MEHEPRGFLSHADGAREFVGRNAVLAIGYHANRDEPMLQGQRGVFKDGSDSHRKLLLAAFALPELARTDERMLCGVAERAEDSIRPAKGNGELESVLLVGEKLDSRLQRFRKLGFVGGAHTYNVSPESGCV